MKCTCVTKGSVHDAHVASARYGLAAHNARKLQGCEQVVFETRIAGVEGLQKLAHWIRQTVQTPYPVGSLLYYRNVEERQ